jgi:hypothetical protein
MVHRSVFVGARAACLMVSLWTAGCGQNAAHGPAVGAHSEQMAAPRKTPPLRATRPIERATPAAGSPVIPAQFVAPLSGDDASPVATRVDRQELHHAIDLAGHYLIRVCGDDGQFAYQVSLDPAAETASEYNLLRHAGTIYALHLYGTWRSDKSATTAALRAVDFLKRRALAPVEGQEELLAVWSRPETESDVDAPQAKLGGAGLALIALTTAERSRPGTVRLDQLQGLARFILYMQKPDGSFYSIYVPSRGGRDEQWSSLYYPGEAALGLLRLYAIDPQPQWREGAARALNYLARYRRDRVTIEADHWALLATAELFAMAEREHRDIDRAGLTRHAAQICTRMLAEVPQYAASRALAGCLTDDGRTCPTATRLEGMQAILPWFGPDDDALRGRMLPAIDAAIAFLARAQVQSGPHAGAIPDCAVRTVASPEEGNLVRIDYVQHALCAMLQYDALRRE